MQCVTEETDSRNSVAGMGHAFPLPSGRIDEALRIDGPLALQRPALCAASRTLQQRQYNATLLDSKRQPEAQQRRPTVIRPCHIRQTSCNHNDCGTTCRRVGLDGMGGSSSVSTLQVRGWWGAVGLEHLEKG
uniref:Uncharacterized protein n=1 Tax=Eutreptiella gymnastica TaxID=73025 RepID=A0A7S4FSU3_9EUGL|mmetsp:Transcript_14406/g.23027  ORF Transcript_14406/g.23027 Transcript_14406/m.23027 type:complete len:132 (+) Transcript_14406:1323-1718(+)